jgi:hypothetical protein
VSFVLGTPLNYIDPTGHEPWFIPGWNNNYMQQQDGNTCAVVSIAVVLSIYSGSVVTQSDVQPLFPNTYAGIGVPPVQQAITLRLVDPSLQATFYTGTREDILESLQRGDPVLVTFALPGLEVGHAVVAVGYDPDTDEIQFFNSAFNRVMKESEMLDEYQRGRNFDSFDEVWAAPNIFIPPNSMITFHQETIPIPALPDLDNVFGASHVRNRMLMR